MKNKDEILNDIANAKWYKCIDPQDGTYESGYDKDKLFLIALELLLDIRESLNEINNKGL